MNFITDERLGCTLRYCPHCHELTPNVDTRCSAGDACKNCYRRQINTSPCISSPHRSAKRKMISTLRNCMRAKKVKTIAQIGCTNHQFAQWIHFQLGLVPMTEWSFDHVFPMRTMDDDILIWCNVMVVSQVTNMEKGNKLRASHFIEQKRRLMLFRGVIDDEQRIRQIDYYINQCIPVWCAQADYESTHCIKCDRRVDSFRHGFQCRECFRADMRGHAKRRYHADTHKYKTQVRLRKFIRGEHSASLERLIGCSNDTFRAWLEYNFRFNKHMRIANYAVVWNLICIGDSHKWFNWVPYWSHRKDWRNNTSFHQRYRTRLTSFLIKRHFLLS